MRFGPSERLCYLPVSASVRALASAPLQPFVYVCVRVFTRHRFVGGGVAVRPARGAAADRRPSPRCPNRAHRGSRHMGLWSSWTHRGAPGRVAVCASLCLCVWLSIHMPMFTAQPLHHPLPQFLCVVQQISERRAPALVWLKSLTLQRSLAHGCDRRLSASASVPIALRTPPFPKHENRVGKTILASAGTGKPNCSFFQCSLVCRLCVDGHLR